MEFEDDSVDLITVCDAVHWFDITKFFDEAQRILAPGGVLAILASHPYVLPPEEVHSDELNDVITKVRGHDKP